MANMGKQKVSSKSLSNVGRKNVGQKKNLFEPGKFPQPIQNVKPATPTTDLSDYRQPQPGEMITNVMGSVSSSQSVPAGGGNMTPVNQLKSSSGLNSPVTKPVEKHEATSNQTGLPDGLKAGVENLSGYSLDNVRVHYNSSKPAQLEALAYTQGTDIHVAPGQEKHLPHEAWHVVQQMREKVKPTIQTKGVGINDDMRLEKEADLMGAKAMSQDTSSTQQHLAINLGNQPIQRMKKRIKKKEKREPTAEELEQARQEGIANSLKVAGHGRKPHGRRTEVPDERAKRQAENDRQKAIDKAIQL